MTWFTDCFRFVFVIDSVFDTAMAFFFGDFPRAGDWAFRLEEPTTLFFVLWRDLGFDLERTLACAFGV